MPPPQPTHVGPLAAHDGELEMPPVSPSKEWTPARLQARMDAIQANITALQKAPSRRVDAHLRVVQVQTEAEAHRRHTLALQHMARALCMMHLRTDSTLRSVLWRLRRNYERHVRISDTNLVHELSLKATECFRGMQEVTLLSGASPETPPPRAHPTLACCCRAGAASKRTATPRGFTQENLARSTAASERSPGDAHRRVAQSRAASG